MEPEFIIEDYDEDGSCIIFLLYYMLGESGKESISLIALDEITISDTLIENHKIALERVEELKHARITTVKFKGDTQ